MRASITIIVFAFLCINCSKSTSTIENPPVSVLDTQATEIKIKELVSQMTLEEKAGQMLNIGLPAILTGAYFDARDSAVFHKENFHSLISQYAVGSIHNTPGYPASKEDWYRIVKEIQDTIMSKSRLGIPIIYGIDNIHGANYVNGSVIFPHQLGVAATWNPDLSENIGAITSYESRAASLPWNYNPNADIAANPLWGRFGESFGEDPYLISEMTTAYIRGSQKLGLDHQNSTAVCVKHFLGYGAGNNGKDRANAIIPEKDLRQYYLPPFEQALNSGAMSIMISSNAINGVPCHINSYYINDILKGEMNFKGVVISDFSDVEYLVEAHEVARDKKEATKLAINAGLDMIMNPYNADIVDIIVELVHEGEISQDRIDDAVTRILRLKFYLNLFEQPYSNPADFTKFGSDEHIAANYDVAAESITLLKNKGAVLPLDRTKKVLVTGYSSNSINILNGAWSRSFLGQDTLYNDPSKLTIYKAIEKELGVSKTLFAQGTNYLEDINTDETVRLAKKADYVVVCVGEVPATEKPSDINELDLPDTQVELIKKLSEIDIPIILVMVQGRPRIIGEIEALADGIILAYLPGQEGGRAISDILFGKVNPSGKLPFTYPKYTGNILPYNHKKTDIRDINWGYDGFYPQYKFGHGLSYTKFEYNNLKLNKNNIGDNESFELSVTVKNVGKSDGKEVVQVYFKDVVASVAPDIKRLVRFKKISLKSGEQKTVTFSISTDELKFVDQYNNWVIEPGSFDFFIGDNREDAVSINYKK